uniref:type II toxin-antitoxin system RelE/ParE family toxin n=1 Tax=uncultured Sphingomonas sp. TaxID=158754 RepID=UPI0035CBBC77
MRLVWRAKARRDVDEIVEYIAARNLVAAEKIESLIQRAVELLSVHPFMYRPGRLPETREAVVHPNYIVVYRVRNDVVTILAVLHARQNYP